MTRVLWLAAGPMNWYSSKARVHWVAERMENAIDMQWGDAKQQDFLDADVVIFQKRFDIGLSEALREAGKKVIWDICDPLYWWSPDNCRELLPHLDAVVTSNKGLERDFRAWSGGVVPVQTIADRVKLEHYPEHRIHTATDPIQMIWFGLGANRFTLLGALTVMERAVANGYRLALTIQDDQPENDWKHMSNTFTITQVEYQWDCEYKVLHTHDIAILPPYPGAWGRVKSNNKDLTAWACGLPVTHGADYLELLQLFDPATRQVVADENYKELIANWEIGQSVQEWEALCAS